MKKHSLIKLCSVFISLILIFQITGSNKVLARDANEKDLLERLINEQGDSIKKVFKDTDKYQVQILYTRVSKDENEKSNFTSFSYNLDGKQYFYPASAIKLSACVLALEKLNNLNIDGLNKDTPLVIKKDRGSQKSQSWDSGTKDSKPTIANFIKKVLVVSDNNSFDRLYEFLGQEYYNKTMWEKGYKNFLVMHRLGNPMSSTENKYTNSFDFYKGNEVIYSQPMVYNTSSYEFNNIKDLTKGVGYISKGKYIASPKDFSKANFMSIQCMQDLLMAIVYPQYIEENKRFNLTEKDYEFLKEYLSMIPRECENPKYNYNDSYVKYFMFGDSKEKIPENIKIYNKIGCAYGYLIDNAYIVDEKNNVEFFLTAVVYCNENNVFNDGKYEYNKIGLPFLAKLGRIIYGYELNSKT
ncbi:serine hydrolase [Clostridium grantii]|uniref:Beta-lactamase enzyme family protein n=1 Tax=Clostridium grantii DSM 8605 TaxID=1121316 RepID=A0A1M5RH21_9CLOT|nr:serine hydrolase [Clostridium grantii]SHH25585.1 Beta-lactamase enzyme family protein [Clostridium grantii DSM 8605]